MAENITLERLENFLTDDSIGLEHRVLWLLLWEGELRVLDLLSLEVQDVRLEQRAIRSSAGNASRSAQGGFSARAAELLGELIGDRTDGPLFAVGQRALTWEEAVSQAEEHGLVLHAFRTGGKRHRTESA